MGALYTPEQRLETVWHLEQESMKTQQAEKKSLPEASVAVERSRAQLYVGKKARPCLTK